MTVHGNFSELTFVNSTTPAINAVNLNAIESTLKITDTELARSLSFNWEFYKEMFFNCSQRTINRFLDYTDWTGTNGPTISEATHSESLIHGRAVKMLQPTNDAEELAIFDSSHTQQNLNNFDSLDSASTADLICLLCYISDTTYITRITIRLGEDTSNYYYYNWTTGLVNGWNILTIDKNSMSTTGSPAGWSAIDYVAYRALFAANAQNEYVIYNHCALVRADQTTATLMNPFVGNDYSDNWDVDLMTPSSQFLIYKDAQFEEICVLSCMLDGVATTSPDFLGCGLVCSSFSASMRVIARNTKDTQGIMWYVDDDNWILFHIDDADLTVTRRFGGVLGYYYTAYASDLLAIGTTFELKLDKIGGTTVRCTLIDESGTNEVIEVSGEALPFSDTTEGEVGIGCYTTDQLSSIQDFVVSNRRTDHIKLPKMETINKNRVQVVRKSADESRSSTTTQANDSELFARIKPYGLYKVTANIYAYGNATPDIATSWATTGDVTTSTYKAVTGSPVIFTSVDSTELRRQAVTVANTVDYGTITTDTTWIQEEFFVTTDEDGGMLYFRWAQDTSDANAVYVRKDSFLYIEKIDDNF